MKAFEDLTAKKMSRFVTLCASQGYSATLPSQHPNASTGIRSTPPLSYGAGVGGRMKTCSQDVFDISGQRSNDKQR